ncbi:MAG: hypothetical protein U5L00_08295 [Desulfovermiculus sp.]|nr:hypothetical protein [Desulfovermiculus sp.]
MFFDEHKSTLALLQDALLCIVQAADIAGMRPLLVHAKDERARRW